MDVPVASRLVSKVDENVRFSFQEKRMEGTKLVEVEETMLSEWMKDGLSIKETDGGEAVLCTNDRTYALKHAGTSNVMYLVDPEYEVDGVLEIGTNEDVGTDKDYAIVATLDHHLEPVEVDPDLKRLEMHLSRTLYEGEDLDSEACGVVGSTLDELDEIMPFSRSQILQGLKAMDAVEFEGRWRKLDPRYITYVLDLIFATLAEKGMDRKHISEEALVGTLESDGVPSQVTRHCIQKFCMEGKNGFKEMDEALACAHYGTEILVEKQKLPVDEFLLLWKQRVPEELNPELEWIRGVGLVCPRRSGAEIKYFPECKLSRNPDRRFIELFQERAEWYLEDLLPYIDKLNLPGMKTDGLIVKYTRRIVGVDPSDKVYYKLKTTAIPEYHF